MPRLDRTFSGKDIVRFYEDHLTFSEQAFVEEEICGIKEVESIKEELLEILINAIPILNTIFSVAQALNLAGRILTPNAAIFQLQNLSVAAQDRINAARSLISQSDI